MSHQQSMFMVEELKRLPMSVLRDIFRETFLTKEHLIKGDVICLCDRPIHAHAKTMDKRLVRLMRMALDHLKENGKQLEDKFDKAEVYGDSSIMVSDFNKLHVWGLVEMVRYRVYRFTERGKGFMFGSTMIPRRVWVYNDRGDRKKRIIIEDDEMVSVDQVDDRWQTGKQDYNFDYITLRLAKKEGVQTQ